MTNMKRLTIAFPDEIDEAVMTLRKTDRFARCSYSQIVRYLVELGIKADQRKGQRVNEEIHR